MERKETSTEILLRQYKQAFYISIVGVPLSMLFLIILGGAGISNHGFSWDSFTPIFIAIVGGLIYAIVLFFVYIKIKALKKQVQNERMRENSNIISASDAL